MTDVRAVGGLPGGAAFVALWDQVDGDPGGIDALASAMVTAAENAGQQQSRVSTGAASVASTWDGKAADAFVGYLGRFDTNAKAVGTGLEQAAKALKSASSALDGAKTGLQTIAGRIVDYAEKVRAQARQRAAAADDPDENTGPDPENLIRKAVAEGCARAQGIVDETNAVLGDAAAAVQAGSKEPAFLSMKTPGDMTYLPATGKPLDWAPEAPPDPTAPAGSDGTAGATGGSSGGGPGGGYAGGGSAGGGGGGGGAPAVVPSGDVKGWIEEAKKILMANGVREDQIDENAIATIIDHESSGNPNAINEWDSNAAKGTPSKGLMQCIDPTFDSYKLPGHEDIWNPVDNIIAGVRYSLSRYGSMDNVPGVANLSQGEGYVGY